MNGFNITALIVAFGLLLFFATLGRGILNQWETPVVVQSPASSAAPLLPVTAGPQPTLAPPAGVQAQTVTMPGSGQPVGTMPVPAGSPPPPSGNPSQPLAH